MGDVQIAHIVNQYNSIRGIEMEQKHKTALYMMTHHSCNGIDLMECTGQWHSDYLRYGKITTEEFIGASGFFCENCFEHFCPEESWEPAPTLTRLMAEALTYKVKADT